MGASIRRDDGPMTGINVTPLVDVVLVLLIVLMVAGNYLASKSIPMELPKGATGETISTTLAISLDRDGRLFLDAKPMDEAELRTKVRVARAKDPEARAVIAADGQTVHARIVRVMDLLREEKVTRFAIQVDPEVVRR